MNSIQVRGAVTVVIWLSYLALVFLGMESLGAWVSLLAFVLMMPLIVVTGGMWGMFGNAMADNENKSESSEVSAEKRKRERLDNVLRDLSNEDLVALRQRLSDGTIDDEVLYDQLIGDDGEIVNHSY